MWEVETIHFNLNESLFAAINATARAYVSKVTTLEERTTHVSLISLFQSMGFILGPAVQAALSPIGSGEPNPDSHITFNLFTATGSGFPSHTHAVVVGI